MPLDPQNEVLLSKLLELRGQPLHQRTIPEIRKLIDVLSPPPTPIPEVSEEKVDIPASHGIIPATLYRPQSAKPLPIIVYFPGGGWIASTHKQCAHFCRTLAKDLPCAVLSVSYRLAPEHAYPAALEDCLTAVRWAAQHAASMQLDAHSLVVAGDSAGGNLATVTALAARDRRIPSIQCQLLLYPILDAGCDTESYQQYAQGYFFEKKDLLLSWECYAPDPKERAASYLSPLKTENFAGVPATIMLSAECDVLRSENEQYAQKLLQAKVPLIYKKYPGTLHGFLLWSDQLQKGQQAMADIISALKLLVYLDI